MSEPINGFKPVRVVSKLIHPDRTEIGYVLEDEQSSRFVLLLEPDVADQVQAAILVDLLGRFDTPLGMNLAEDLRKTEAIDQVAVQKGVSPSSYDLEFRVGQQTRFTLQLPWSAAVRFLHSLRKAVQDHIRSSMH